MLVNQHGVLVRTFCAQFYNGKFWAMGPEKQKLLGPFEASPYACRGRGKVKELFRYYTTSFTAAFNFEQKPSVLHA